jgi:hypothetical protein
VADMYVLEQLLMVLQSGNEVMARRRREIPWIDLSRKVIKGLLVAKEVLHIEHRLYKHTAIPVVTWCENMEK